MTTEVAPTLAELLYESLEPLNDPDPDEALRIFTGALESSQQQVYDLVRGRDDGSGWAVLFDVENCPAWALPYLAQYVGVEVQPAWSEEQLRNEIRQPTGWTRGRAASIEIAARRNLTGTLHVVLRDRTPEVGYLYVRVLDSECPDPAVTEADVVSQKPAWIVLDFAVFEGETYADLRAGFATYADVKAAFATYADVLNASL
jgi:hypothetical protein